MRTWNIVKKNVDGEEVAVIYDMWDQVITKKEFDEIVAQANRFYDLPEIEKDVEEHNRYEHFNQMYGMSHFFGRLEVGDKLEIPDVVYGFKKFSPHVERKWSCKCGLCGTKISNDKDEGYYSLIFHNYIRDLNIDLGKSWFGYRRACSVECAEVLWRDVFKRWITENDYKEFFIMD